MTNRNSDEQNGLAAADNAYRVVVNPHIDMAALCDAVAFQSPSYTLECKKNRKLG
jgi:hypothetical protein